MTLLDDYSMARGAPHGRVMASLDEYGMARRVRHYRTVTRGRMSTAQLAGSSMAGTWPHLVAFPERSPRHCCRHCRAVTDLTWPEAGDPLRDLAPVRMRGLLQWAAPDRWSMLPEQDRAWQ